MLALVFLVAGKGIGFLGATEIHVPEDYPTISQGLLHSAAGDSVVIACGTYFEHAMFVSHGVTLRSETGDPGCVLIDGEQQGSILLCWNAAAPLRVESITFLNGGAPSGANGGGLNLLNTPTVTVSNCIFASNYASDRGGAIYAIDSSVHIDNCEFSDNRATQSEMGAGDGGAIYASDSWLDITDSQFSANVGNHGEGSGGGGALYVYRSQVGISRCEFLGNYADNGPGGYGGAIQIASSSSALLLEDSHFEANWTYGAGGAVGLGSGTTAGITGSSFIQNRADHGSSLESNGESLTTDDCVFVRSPTSSILACEISASVNTSLEVTKSTFVGLGSVSSGYCVWAGQTLSVANTLFVLVDGLEAIFCGNTAPTLECSDIYTPNGSAWVDCYADQLGVNGNISEDPQFCGEPGSGNYYLQSDSPCAPANNSCGELIGALPVGCEAVATKTSSISAIKSLY